MTVRTAPRSAAEAPARVHLLRPDRSEPQDSEWTAPDLPPASRVGLVAAGVAALVVVGSWLAQLL